MCAVSEYLNSTQYAGLAANSADFTMNCIKYGLNAAKDAVLCI
jgi:hypothetical protein